jgi:protein involved in polysaccharide export with SLBB domain
MVPGFAVLRQAQAEAYSTRVVVGNSLLFAAFVIVANAGQNQYVPPAQAVSENAPLYRLTPGDVIEVRLFYNPELNDTVQIRPDGRISMQLIGEVAVASKTIGEAANLLEERYAKEVRTPNVTVQVKTYAAQKVYVVGEVVRPEVINLPGPMTVLEAIGEAGGIKNTGNKKLAVLLRKGPGGTPEGRRLILFDHRVLSADASILLEPFDVVMVPESRVSRLDRWVDQTIRQMIPVMMTSGFDYFVSRQTGGAATVPVF